MRTAKLTRGPSTLAGTPGKIVTDTGKIFYTIEKPWLDDKPDVSCEATGDYPCDWEYSNAHKCNNYRLQTKDGRAGVEIHAANVQEQLKGCIAVGMAAAHFAANSIHPGMPSVDCPGVIESVTALGLFEAEYRDDKGNQVSFVLTIC